VNFTLRVFFTQLAFEGLTRNVVTRRNNLTVVLHDFRLFLCCVLTYGAFVIRLMLLRKYCVQFETDSKQEGLTFLH
jgi:hypothetical protein